MHHYSGGIQLLILLYKFCTTLVTRPCPRGLNTINSQLRKFSLRMQIIKRLINIIIQSKYLTFGFKLYLLMKTSLCLWPEFLNLLTCELHRQFELCHKSISSILIYRRIIQRQVFPFAAASNRHFLWLQYSGLPPPRVVPFCRSPVSCSPNLHKN